jgi:carboxypeptidase Taq
MAHIAAYDRLKHRFSMIQQLRNAAGILNRDMITAMPAGAANDRAAQLVALSAAAHDYLTAPQAAEDLATAEGGINALAEGDAINLRAMRRQHTHAAGVPAALVARAAALGATGDQNHSAWRRAGDWDAVRHHYEDIFAVQRDIAAAKQAALGTATPYDALIDEYDPGGSAAQIESLFAPVDNFLRDAIPQAARKHPDEMVDVISCPLPAQEAIFRAVAAAFGFDFTRGVYYMIDQHPSCYGTPDDQRFTTFAREDGFADSFLTLAHEVGHGLYEQNLPAAWRYQPAGASVGMTIHESQSLFWEKQVASHPSFKKWLAPLSAKHGGPKDVVPPRSVIPSLIRVTADEMTYPMHIFLRFDLEKRLMDGSLRVKDIPDAWAEGMRARLGIAPDNHTEGCLQDIHWAFGAVGYFPSYSLGAMTAAQLMAALRRDVPDADDRIGAGDFAPLLEWLTRNIHTHGSRLMPMDLIRQATGETLNPSYFIKHLSDRYLTT